MNKISQNKEEYEAKLNEMYKYEDLFKNRKKNKQSDSHVEFNLVRIEEKNTIIKRIINFVKKIFRR